MITVKEVMEAAASLVGLDPNGEGFSSEKPILLRCCNFIENELALDYFPLVKMEPLTAEEGAILYTAFSEAPIRIFSVFGERGEEKGFCALADRLLVQGERVNVEYAYAPREKGEGEAAEFSPRISLRVAAYGVAAEYLLSTSRFAEAASFDKKYRDALRAAAQVRKKLTMKGRRWA